MKVSLDPRQAILSFVSKGFACILIAWAGLFIWAMVDSQRPKLGGARLQPEVLAACKRIDLYESADGTEMNPVPNRSVSSADRSFLEVKKWLTDNVVQNDKFTPLKTTNDHAIISCTYIVLYSSPGLGAAQLLLMPTSLPLNSRPEQSKKILQSLPLGPGCFDFYEREMIRLRKMMPPMTESIPLVPMR